MEESIKALISMICECDDEITERVISDLEQQGNLKCGTFLRKARSIIQGEIL